MNIIDVDYKWNGGLSARKKTDLIILHHRAGNGDALSIHNSHIKKGWAGIGYHFYVRKNGDIYRGRPIEKAGAHCTGYNDRSIGICFEGNFENESMTKAQIISGKDLIDYIRKNYSNFLAIAKHSDLANTLCPGKHFDVNKLLSVSNDDVVNQMFLDGVITIENVKNWEFFLTSQKPKSEYVRTIIQRYQKALKNKE